MQNLIGDFLLYLSVEKGDSKNTIISYRNDLSDFLFFVENKLKIEPTLENLAKLTHSDFRSLLS